MGEPSPCRRGGDHPTNGRTPTHLRSVHTGPGRASACPTAKTGRPRPTASVQERTTKDTGPGRTHRTTRTLVGCAVGWDTRTCGGSGLCVCAARPHRGGGGQGCTRPGVPIYVRPGSLRCSRGTGGFGGCGAVGLVYFCGGTGVAGGSVGGREVPAVGSSPLILWVGESACGVARVVRSWGSELGHGRLPPYPPSRVWRGPGLSGGWQVVAAGEWSRAAPTSPASAQGGCPTSGRPAGRGPYWPDRRRRSRRARRSDFDGQPPRWTMRPSVFTVRCPGAAGWPHVAHTPGRDSGMVVRPASSSAQRWHIHSLRTCITRIWSRPKWRPHGPGQVNGCLFQTAGWVLIGVPLASCGGCWVRCVPAS